MTPILTLSTSAWAYFQMIVASTVATATVTLSPVVNATSYTTVEGVAAAAKRILPIIGVVFVIASSNSIVPVLVGVLHATACNTPGPVFTSVVAAEVTRV